MGMSDVALFYEQGHSERCAYHMVEMNREDCICHLGSPRAMFEKAWLKRRLAEEDSEYLISQGVVPA